MTRNVASVAGLAIVVGCGASPEPVTFDTRVLVETLASDELEGRLTGTEGSRKAADYIVAQLQDIGASPLPGADDFRLPFQFTAGVSDGGSGVTLTAGADVTTWDDGVRALSFSDNGSVSGDLVFAGYGLSVPETEGFSYDSYTTLDVADKVVLVLRYFPEDTEGELRGMLSRCSSVQGHGGTSARSRGADRRDGSPFTKRG